MYYIARDVFIYFSMKNRCTIANLKIFAFSDVHDEPEESPEDEEDEDKEEESESDESGT